MIAETIEAIKEHDLVFQSELFAYVQFSERTFYNWQLQDVQTIKKAFEDNRTRTKKALRKKWYDSDNFTAQVALYKLIATDSEYERLANVKQITSETPELPPVIRFVRRKTDKELPDAE